MGRGPGAAPVHGAGKWDGAGVRGWMGVGAQGQYRQAHGVHCCVGCRQAMCCRAAAQKGARAVATDVVYVVHTYYTVPRHVLIRASTKPARLLAPRHPALLLPAAPSSCWAASWATREWCTPTTTSTRQEWLLLVLDDDAVAWGAVRGVATSLASLQQRPLLLVAAPAAADPPACAHCSAPPMQGQSSNDTFPTVMHIAAVTGEAGAAGCCLHDGRRLAAACTMADVWLLLAQWQTFGCCLHNGRRFALSICCFASLQRFQLPFCSSAHPPLHPPHHSALQRSTSACCRA